MKSQIAINTKTKEELILMSDIELSEDHSIYGAYYISEEAEEYIKENWGENTEYEILIAEED